MEGRVISVDVECVATGSGHNDRAPVLVAAVDGEGRCVLKEYIDVPHVYSFLTPITGVDTLEGKNAKSLADVKALLKAKLGPDVILVGKIIQITFIYECI